MKKKQILLAALLLGGGLGIFNSEAQVSITGELTPRTEVRNGFKKPIVEGQDPAIFTEQRTRINLGYTSDQYDVVISLQDIRIWGSTNQIYKTDGGFQNIYEGYGKYKFSAKSNLKVGRMALDYDNARFMGNLGWAMQARSHDGMLYETKFDSAGTTTLHGGFFFNQDGTTPEYAKLVGIDKAPGNYKAMAYLWFNKKFGKSSMSLLAHNNVNQGADLKHIPIQTVGGVGNLVLSDKTTLGVETYYQGSVSSDVHAAAFFGSVNAKLSLGKLTVTPGVEYMTGADGDVTAFNPMYGTNHKFNGFMDYFYVGNGHGNVGLVNPYLQTKTKLSEKSFLLANVHGFMSQVDIGDNFLGTELDLVYVNKISKEVIFKLGTSFLSATDSMKAIKGGAADQSSLNTWTWAQIIFKPKFL